MSGEGIEIGVSVRTDNLDSQFQKAAQVVNTGSKEMADGQKAAAEGANEHASALTALREELQGLINPIRGIRSNLGEIGEAFAAAFAVEKIAEFYEHFSELGQEIGHLSERLGLAVPQVAELGFLAGSMGIPLDSAAMSFSRLQVNMEKASQGSVEQSAAFRALGISVVDSAGNLKTLEQILPELADKFAATADGPNKLAIAAAIGGRGFAEMIPLLDQGSDAMATMAETAKATGTVISTDMAEGMAKSAVQAHTLGQAVDGVGITIYEAFKPALDTLVNSLIVLVEEFNGSIQQGGALNYVLEALVAVFDVVVTVVDTTVVALVELIQLFNLGAQNIGTAAGAIGLAVKDAFSGHWDQAKADVRKGLEDIGKQWDDWSKKSLNDITEFQKRLQDTFSNLGNGVGTGKRDEEAPGVPKPNLPPIDTDAAKIADARIQAEERVKLAAIAIEEEINNTRLKLGQETDAQFIARALALEDQKYAIEVQAIQKRLAVAGLENTDRAKLEGDLLVLEQTHALAKQKLIDEEQIKNKQMLDNELKDFINSKNDELKAASQVITGKEQLGLISTQDAVAQEKALTLAIEQEILKRFDDEHAGLTKGTEEYRKAMAERLKIVQGFNQQMEKLTQQELGDDLKKWQTFGSSVRSTFNSTITGLINGTETFGQAFANILTSIVDGFVQMGLDIVEDWAKTQLTNLLLAQTTQTTQATTQVGSNAAVAGSAAYASTAAIPIIGPELAPAAAATAYAGALSFEGLAFASGGMELDQDQLVYAHKDEMILPAGLSSGIKGMINDGSGGGDTHLHGPFVSAMDTQTGMQFLMKNLPRFAKAVSAYQNKNPNARPKY